jgi:hypothetical protein
VLPSVLKHRKTFVDVETANRLGLFPEKE